VVNRIYTRKYTEAVTPEAKRRLQFRVPASAGPASIGEAAKAEPSSAEAAESIQPYEVFTLTIRGKYFFDPRFGGALIPGRRNQIEPITALSFYTFGGVPRRFSPLSIDATYRPQQRIFANTRMDLALNGGGLRAISATVGYDSSFLKFFQTFYYTRAVTLIPSLAQFCQPEAVGASAPGADEKPGRAADGAAQPTGCKEAGTLRGSQWSPSIFVGNRMRGLYGGTSFFFDFQNRRRSKQSPLISSLFTIGYAYDCCSIALQYYTFNVGVRKENRIAFSFRLNGIGAFGTEQFGQGLR
jgi:LPS-assembly protein